jgi:hypothetical protein
MGTDKHPYKAIGQSTLRGKLYLPRSELWDSFQFANATGYISFEQLRKALLPSHDVNCFASSEPSRWSDAGVFAVAPPRWGFWDGRGSRI